MTDRIEQTGPDGLPIFELSPPYSFEDDAAKYRIRESFMFEARLALRVARPDPMKIIITDAS